MRYLILLMSCVLLSCCVSDPVDENYRGKDAGAMVVSAGALEVNNAVLMLFRKAGQPSGYNTTGGDGMVHYNPNGIFSRAPDYSGHETGQVFIYHLKPGSYEFYMWAANVGAFMGQATAMPTREFSIPFTIKAGETTYVGNFARVAERRLPPELGAQFVVSDKHERDLAIARQREPNLPPVSIQVTDVSRLGERSFVAREPD